MRYHVNVVFSKDENGSVALICLAAIHKAILMKKQEKYSGSRRIIFGDNDT